MDRDATNVPIPAGYLSAKSRKNCLPPSKTAGGQPLRAFFCARLLTSAFAFFAFVADLLEPQTGRMGILPGRLFVAAPQEQVTEISSASHLSAGPFA